MVTLKNLTILNFLSHKKTEISFKENTKLSIEGISGSGKSSIVEAIIWALYGKGRVENRNIIKRGAKFATVTLVLSDGEKEYRLERSVNSTGKHSLDIGEKKVKAYVPLKHIGLKDSQRWVEKELLKSSYTLFINSVAYPQDNIESFVKQTAGKRKELLLEIADTENYDELYEKAKKMLSTMAQEEIRSSVLMENYLSNIASERERVKDTESLEKRYGACEILIESINKKIAESQEKTTYIAQVKARIDLNNSKMKALKEKLEEYGESIKKKDEKIKELNSVDPKTLKSNIDELNAVRSTISELKKALERDYELKMRRSAIMQNKPLGSNFSASLARLNDQLLNIQMSNDAHCEYLNKNCPKLEQEIKKKSIFIEEQIAELKEREAKQEEALKAYTESLASLPPEETTESDHAKYKELLQREEELKKYEGMDAVMIEREKMVTELKNEIHELGLIRESVGHDFVDLDIETGLLMEEYDSLHDDIGAVAQLKEQLAEANNDLLIIKSKLMNSEESKENIKKYEELLSKEKINQKKLNKKIEEVTLAKEAFGSKGIKTIIIDYLIPRLEYRINEILSKMSDFKIRLETQKSKLDDDGSTEGLFINIYNELGECFPLANYSGGQKLKVTVAISEALASMQKTGFRIFDEIFVGLDQESVEGFNEVMHSLQDQFSQIFCISHLQTIKDSFEEKLIVTKEGDTSKVL